MKSVVIKINGERVLTTIDADGVQRLPNDRVVSELFESGALDLNRLAVAVKVRHTCSEATRRWVYQRLGYSVCGYSEVFPHDEIDNPLLEKAERKTSKKEGK